MNSNRHRWRPLLSIARLKGRDRGRLLLSVLLSAGAVAAATALLTTSGYLISRAAERPEILSLSAIIVTVRAFGLSRAVFRYYERVVSHNLAFRLLAQLRLRFFKQLAPLVPSRSHRWASSELLARFVGDVDALQDLYLRALAPPLAAVLVIGAAAFTGWLILPAAGLTLLILLPFAAIVSAWLTAQIASAAGQRQARARADLTRELVEAIDGAPEITIAGRSQERSDHIKGFGERLARIARRDALASATATTLGSFLSYGTALALLIVSAPAVHNDTLRGVWLAALVLLTLGTFEAIATLPAAANRLRACREAATRLDEVCTHPVEVCDPASPKAPNGKGALVIDSVHFRYSAEDPVVLAGASLEIAPNEHVALIGPSGIGKTTLAQLLIRFFDPDRGRITLDGIDLREMNQSTVREAIVLAAQDAHIFNTTLRENLLLARRSASEHELWEALDTVSLGDWVRQLENGLDTLLGEDGGMVSGGQRQRISLARTLIAKPRFIIFDEPTAHLDPQLAQNLIDNLLKREVGLLVITHETDRLANFDRTVKLEAGKLI